MKLLDNISWSDVVAIGAVLGFLITFMRRIFTYVALLDKMQKFEERFSKSELVTQSRFNKQDMTLENQTRQLRLIMEHLGIDERDTRRGI